MKTSIEVYFSRSKIFLLYFYDIYDVNLGGKKFGRSTAYSCRVKVFVEFHNFMKKRIDTGGDETTPAKHFKIKRNLWVFVN